MSSPLAMLIDSDALKTVYVGDIVAAVDAGSHEGTSTVKAQQAGDSPIFVHLDEPVTDIATPPTASKSPKKHCTRTLTLSKWNFTLLPECIFVL